MFCPIETCQAAPGEPCIDGGTGEIIEGGAVHAARYQDRAHVIARHVHRRRRDGINYEVLTAEPGAVPKVIARFSHPGDAFAYAAEIKRRVEEGGTLVNLYSSGI